VGQLRKRGRIWWMRYYRNGRRFEECSHLTNRDDALLKTQIAEHERLSRAGQIVPYVFHRNGKPIREMRDAWSRACKAASLPGRLMHDFRRTAARNLERAGVSRSAAMAMVGHKTESIYRRYAIVDSEALREAAAKIDQAAMGTISGTIGGTTPTFAYERRG